MFEPLKTSDIEAEAVIEGVRKAAAMHPGRRYAPPATRAYASQAVMIIGKGACSYFEDRFGQGKGHACIVGEALYGLGLDPASHEPGEVVPFIRDLGITVPTVDAIWLEAVQRMQDKAMPWGEAVELADEVAQTYVKTGAVPEAWEDVLSYVPPF